MGLFGKILNKLGIGDANAETRGSGHTGSSVPGSNAGAAVPANAAPGSAMSSNAATANDSAPAGTAPTGSAAALPAGSTGQDAPATSAGPAIAAQSASQTGAPVNVVDVVGQLEKKAAAHAEKLNWRTSIVDLLKLLDMDSSLTARKELATELGCPESLMSDSAQMNMWLHKTVLQRIAQNGGNVPKEMLS